MARRSLPLLHSLITAVSLILTHQGSRSAPESEDDVVTLILRQFKLPAQSMSTWIRKNQDVPPRIVEINLTALNLKGKIPPSISNLTNLETMDLSNNMLSGTIPDIFYSLVGLKYLDLHNNKLTGKLPQSLIELPNLATLNVADNDLCGNTFSFQELTDFNFSGNPKLCNSTECNCTSISSPTPSVLGSKEVQRNKTRWYIYPVSSFGALSIVAMLVYFLFHMARHKKAKEQDSMKGVNDLQDVTFTTRMFTYNEICNATQNFSTVIGKGGFGEVYHGILSCGKAIAVKTLGNASKQGLKEFSTEVAILSRARHKNLVSLIGYCMENSYMLIYEYISNGNLRDAIHGKDKLIDKSLLWETRLQIAIDASKGLQYLHSGCEPGIIHRDVKSSNILLSDKMQAKVADFGLSRLKEGGSIISHVSTMNVVGTPGYLDPAYVATNQFTEKSDIYSFGVVLLELISGRAPMDYFSGPSHIVDWVAISIEHGKIEDIVDPTIANEYKMESLQKVVDVAFRCVESDRMKRPKMSQVAHALREALEIEMEPINQTLSQDSRGSSSHSNVELPTLEFIGSL